MILALVLALGTALGPQTPPAPTPEESGTPTPVKLMVSLESSQGVGKERTALFDDGNLVHTTAFRERTTSRRVTLSREERAVVQHVLDEMSGFSLDAEYRLSTVDATKARQLRIEFSDSSGETRSVVFDEVARLPLKLVRLRNTLEGLKERFYQNVALNEKLWDPSDVKVDDLLKHRTTRAIYRVMKDDTLSKNLELVEQGRDGFRLHVTRKDLPRFFDEPEPPAREP